MRYEKTTDEYWHDDGTWILLRAAVEVLLVCDPKAVMAEPDRTSSPGYVTVEDLMAEAWLSSFRHGEDKTLGKQLIWSKKHMFRAWRRLRFEHCFMQERPAVTRLADDSPLVCEHGQLGTRCLDIWDAVQWRCGGRVQEIIAKRVAGYTPAQIARAYGVTTQTILNWMKTVPERIAQEEGE